MHICDFHCDTLFEITSQKLDLYSNSLHVDLERMSLYDSYTQFFALWLENEENAWEIFNDMRNKFLYEVEKNSEKIILCKSFSDILKARVQKKCAAFLSLEGAHMIKDVSDIELLYGLGIRAVSLTWNDENLLAGGADSKCGLSELGRAIIPKIQDLNIIFDVSHLNEKSFWDAIPLLKKPFIASHSNSAAICPHRRNLTDEQFIAICRAGGCVGINLYPTFLSKKPSAATDDIAAHIMHFIKLGGENNIALGTDFDGISTLPAGISGIENLGAVISSLRAFGLSSRQAEKLTCLNFEKILKIIL